jgi:hypothetical protein
MRDIRGMAVRWSWGGQGTVRVVSCDHVVGGVRLVRGKGNAILVFDPSLIDGSFRSP